MIFSKMSMSLRYPHLHLRYLSFFSQTLKTSVLFLLLNHPVLFSWQVLILHYDFLSQQTQDTVVLLRVVSVFFLSQVSLLPCFILQNVAHGRLMLIIPWVSRFHFLCIILHLLVSVVIYNQPFRIFLDMLPHSW